MIGRQSLRPHHTGPPSFEVQARQAAPTQLSLAGHGGTTGPFPPLRASLRRALHLVPPFAETRRRRGSWKEEAGRKLPSAPSEASSPGAGRFRQPDPPPGGAGKEAPERAVPGAGGGFALGLRRGRRGGAAPEGESRSGAWGGKVGLEPILRPAAGDPFARPRVTSSLQPPRSPAGWADRAPVCWTRASAATSEVGRPASLRSARVARTGSAAKVAGEGALPSGRERGERDRGAPVWASEGRRAGKRREALPPCVGSGPCAAGR